MLSKYVFTKERYDSTKADLNLSLVKRYTSGQLAVSTGRDVIPSIRAILRDSIEVGWAFSNLFLKATGHKRRKKAKTNNSSQSKPA